MRERIEKSFDQQGLMKTLGARLVSVEKGRVEIVCEWAEGLTQQNGFFHAGVLTSLADTACGYAALTEMPAEKEVLSVEFKINLLRPAKTRKITAIGKVLKNGRTLTVCEAEIFDETGASLLAKMTATMISIEK